MGRKKGSRNKPKGVNALDLNRKAQHFADLFISGEHIAGAEILAERVLEKIRSSKERLETKYGN